MTLGESSRAARHDFRQRDPRLAGQPLGAGSGQGIRPFPGQGPQPRPSLPRRGTGGAGSVLVVVQKPRLTPEMERMLTVKQRIEEATRFLRDRLSAIPQVREAWAIPIPNGLDLRAFVDEPWLENTGMVLEVVEDAAERFEGITLRFRVLPASSIRATYYRDDLVSIVPLRDHL